MKRTFLYLMVLVMMIFSIEGCYLGWWEDGGMAGVEAMAVAKVMAAEGDMAADISSKVEFAFQRGANPLTH